MPDPQVQSRSFPVVLTVVAAVLGAWILALGLISLTASHGSPGRADGVESAGPAVATNPDVVGLTLADGAGSPRASS